VLVPPLAKATEGLTGSEIENAFVESLYVAFDSEKEPTDLDVARVLTEFVPLSKLMAELSPVTSKPATRGRIKTSHSEVLGSYHVSGCGQGAFQLVHKCGRSFDAPPWAGSGRLQPTRTAVRSVPRGAG
jgi:hypothetical protein